MILVFITVGVRKPRSANKPLTCYARVDCRAEAAGRGLGRDKTVACAACSTQNLPSSQRFRLLDDHTDRPDRPNPVCTLTKVFFPFKTDSTARSCSAFRLA